jgi:dihydrofolate reductase
MPELILDISISLDGFAAGPNPDLENPLGQNGMLLHDWAFGTRAWQEAHGGEGGEDNVDSQLTATLLEQCSATIMGRKMFSGGSGPWESDPNANGWWGDDPPFHHPVFVLTSHEREPLEMQGGTTFTFVADGIESALEQARAAAGDSHIRLGGGASVAQQYLRAGLLDQMQLHVAPLLLGGGVRLFEEHPAGRLSGLELQQVLESPTGVVHLTYTPAR